MSIFRDGRHIGFIGGDMRISILAAIMKDHGFDIKTYGVTGADRFTENEECDAIEKLFAFSEIIVLPVPVTRDKTCVFAERPEISILLRDLIFDSKIFGKKIFFGGLIPRDFKASLEAHGHTVIDVFENDRLINNNAIATAEGALMIAMEKLTTTIISTKFAVLGFGRIGSHLANIISALGGEVTVFARRDEALNNAQRHGYRAVKLLSDLTEKYEYEIARELDGASVIFNTVPSVIVKRGIMEKMHKRPLYVELASYPYGIDSKDARELEFNTVYAPSLPGRYSPVSAAEYIFEAISYYMSELEG